LNGARTRRAALPLALFAASCSVDFEHDGAPRERVQSGTIATHCHRGVEYLVFDGFGAGGLALARDRNDQPIPCDAMTRDEKSAVSDPRTDPPRDAEADQQARLELAAALIDPAIRARMPEDVAAVPLAALTFASGYYAGVRHLVEILEPKDTIGREFTIDELVARYRTREASEAAIRAARGTPPSAQATSE